MATSPSSEMSPLTEMSPSTQASFSSSCRSTVASWASSLASRASSCASSCCFALPSCGPGQGGAQGVCVCVSVCVPNVWRHLGRCGRTGPAGQARAGHRRGTGRGGAGQSRVHRGRQASQGQGGPVGVGSGPPWQARRACSHPRLCLDAAPKNSRPFSHPPLPHTQIPPSSTNTWPWLQRPLTRPTTYA